MSRTRTTLTGLFMVATFVVTLIGFDYTEKVTDFLADAGGTAAFSAHAESAVSSPGSEGKSDKAPVPSSDATGGKEGCCGACDSPTASASAGGNACCSPQAAAPCCSQKDVGSAKVPSGASGGDSCCPTGDQAAAASRGSVGIFEVAKLDEYKASGDWCTAHGVPESMCVKCNPALIAQFKERGDWCSGHDLPESLCPLCRKELAEAGIGRDWCSKHGVPASQCGACLSAAALDHNGRSIPQADALASALQLSVEETAGELTPGVGPAVFEYDPAKRKGINPNCMNHLSKIKLESVQIQERIDLKIQPVGAQPVNKKLACYGEVRYDQNRYALISPRGGGVVKEVRVDLGDEVRAGEVLAIVDSVEFGRAKGEYLRASAQVQRWKWLNDSYAEGQASGAVARKEIVEARAELDAAQVELAIAEQTLRNFGLDDDRIAKIRETRDTGTHLEVTAPFDATLAARKAVTGENVEEGQPLFEIADLSRMWLFLSVFAEDLGELSEGMPVAFQPEGQPGIVIPGEITWISPNLDEKTRTASVRAELNNPDKQLRQGLFGTGIIGVHEGEPMVVVPMEAIQWDGCCNMAFVQTREGEYEPRKVRLGDQVENGYVVLAGLSVGESVATQGSYLLKTEVLKSQIGAGCCGND